MEESADVPVQGSGSDDEETGGKRFFACYLLTSLSPRHKGHTYIGFTVNPRRRIRQHNGELKSGAWRTKSKRPWEMVICIYGFPTHVSALQFEWAWQHPRESLAVRKVAESYKSFSGVANKIKLAYSMLNVSKWQSMNITVNYFSTKYKKHSAGCPSLPKCMRVEICQMDDLPCYGGLEYFVKDNDSECEVKGDENGPARDLEDNINTCPLSTYENSAKEFSCSVSSSCSVQASEDIETPPQSKAQLEQIPPTPTINERARHNEGLVLQEIEIIDIFTPSPEQRAPFGKRSRITPDIIDLTKSPVFIQL
ncbi:hypothetical protein MLD38_018258 [Melastoma candidum]|uniref:Uncharacterized protein n=1 Tax=Melastoma candidum TaxID=119954 RepID=A0ACB9QXB1_9MYRT|nr:hypothetical protein MLD38_018258 [Melastoma candidum]